MSETNMTKRGELTWFSSGEDEGPDVGLSVGLGNGHHIYVGEIANKTLEDAGISPSDHPGIGWWILIDDEPVAPVADIEAARRLCDEMHRAINYRPLHER